MSGDLALRSTDVPAEFETQIHMASALAGSNLLPVHLRGRPENVLVILAGARALDVSWFWAAQSMYVVDGKLALSAELMRALVLRAGHRFRVVEHTDKTAKVAIVRKDDPDELFTSEFTIADATAANLLNKGPWKSYRKAMLLARATSQGVRAICPDVLFGIVYTPEELGAAVDEEGKPVVARDGTIVIDAEVQPEVDQAFIDKCATVFGYDQDGEGERWQNLENAANTYMTAKRLGILLRTPTGSDITLDLLWLERLRRELDDDDLTEEELRTLWKFANGTGTLDQPYQGDDLTIGQAIKENVELIKAYQTHSAGQATELQVAAAASWDEPVG